MNDDKPSNELKAIINEDKANEKSEEPGDTDSASGNSNTSNDDDGGGDDDIVEVPPVPIRRDDLFLPRQLPVDVFHSVEEKRRRRHERSLLQQLEEGDEAVKELRLFWRSQLGSSREEDLLRKAATGIGDPSAWKESQDILEELCKEHPTFLHAFALLSKLYCLMGRLEDSQTMALEVLKLKPWHFLAIETMVATSYALNQINTSVYWASRRMPPPSRTEKRREWVDRALKDSLDYENGLTSFEQTIPGEQTEDTDYDCNNDSFRNEDTDSWQ
eukprot:jgi/Psemu1/12012/gm1.12012_g